MTLGKGKYLGRYLLEADFRVAGGRSRITSATKDGKRWFIKEFLSPKYPTEDSPGSEKTKAYKRNMCVEFEAHQRNIMRITNAACSEGSNLVCAKELMLHDTSYYKISEWVDTTTMNPKEVAKLSFKEIIIILRSLASSLRILHNSHIVHGDLKPENILIKKTASGIYTTKLIDFDDSYFEAAPPADRQAVVGTPEYYAPEVFDYISDEDERLPGSVLTTKADIYSLGIIFCEYLSGERPLFDKSKYIYTYAATNAGEPVGIPYSENITRGVKSLLVSMLEKNPNNRPNILQVFNELKKIDISRVPVPAKQDTRCPRPDYATMTEEERKPKGNKSLPVVFPRLKLPKSLVLKLRKDASDAVLTSSKEPEIEKPLDKTEHAEPDKHLLKVKSSSASAADSSVKPRLKGTLIK